MLCGRYLVNVVCWALAAMCAVVACVVSRYVDIGERSMVQGVVGLYWRVVAIYKRMCMNERCGGT